MPRSPAAIARHLTALALLLVAAHVAGPLPRATAGHAPPRYRADMHSSFSDVAYGQLNGWQVPYAALGNGLSSPAQLARQSSNATRPVQRADAWRSAARPAPAQRWQAAAAFEAARVWPASAIRFSTTRAPPFAGWTVAG